MKIADIFPRFFFWGLLGCCLFNVYVVIAFRTGIVYTARHKDGTLKRNASVSGIVNSLILLICILCIQVASDYFGLELRCVQINFIGLYLWNYALYIVLVIYDTFVIDYLVIVKWRPKFLMIPEAMNAQSMRQHIVASIPIAPAIGLLLTASSTWIAPKTPTAFFIWRETAKTGFWAFFKKLFLGSLRRFLLMLGGL
ncbi:MAG: hypothetical protein GY832_18660 [Chloroflexi bacterium]|nr:hypothetical protein [Chloroflexota bacterium]